MQPSYLARVRHLGVVVGVAHVVDEEVLGLELLLADSTDQLLSGFRVGGPSFPMGLGNVRIDCLRRVEVLKKESFQSQLRSCFKSTLMKFILQHCPFTQNHLISKQR